MTAVCAWCGESRVAGPLCPECGADYEKAAQIKAGKKAESAPRKSKKELRAKEQEERFIEAWAPVKDVNFEYKLCLFAVPGLLAFCFLLEMVGIGDGMLRIVFGMPVHEMGHALVGWFSGFNSIPSLWFTSIPEDRGYIASVLVFGGLCYLANFARMNAHGGLLMLGVLLLILQFIFTIVIAQGTAHVAVTWGGDGVGFMLATVLMIGFNFDKQTNWYKGYLRWGFAFIGAAAFADLVTPWWRSLSDISHVPYGVTGGTHTDTYKLMVYHGWTMDEVIHRYVNLSVLCMLVFAGFYVRGIKQAGKAVTLRRKIQSFDEAEASEEAGSASS